MKKIDFKKKKTIVNRGQEEGAVTILTILLISFASAVVFGGAFMALRGSQVSGTVVHETTQAQAKAWKGVETIRQVLLSMHDGEIEKLAEGDVINLGSALPGIKASIVKNDFDSRYLTVDITGCSSDSNAVCASGSNTDNQGATATIEVVFDVSSDYVSRTFGTGNTALNVNGNLHLNEKLTLSGFTDQESIFVNGTVIAAQNGGISGNFKELKATGDVHINGSTSFDQPISILSQGNIILNGGGTYNELKSANTIDLKQMVHANLVQSDRDVQLENGIIDIVKAHGRVMFKGSASIATDIVGLGEVYIENGVFKTAKSNGSVTVKGEGKTNMNVYAGGSVNIEGGSYQEVFTNNYYNGRKATVEKVSAKLGAEQNEGTVYSLISEASYRQNQANTLQGLVKGDFSESSNTGSFSGTVLGNKNYPPQNPNINIQSVATEIKAVVVPTFTVPRFSFDMPVKYNIDVNEYKVVSNYVVYKSGNDIKVDVKNISGVDNGTYFYVNKKVGSVSFNNMLCENANPTALSDCVMTIAWKDNSGGYSSASVIGLEGETWTLNSSATTMGGLAPGIYVFDGSLNITRGDYHNTLMATVDLSVNNDSTEIAAVNYAGYSRVCDNTYYKVYPKQICDKERQVYVPIAMGENALVAGSYDEDGNYVGGLINLQAVRIIFGNVRAGNLFQSSAVATIMGGVSADNLGIEGDNEITQPLTLNLNLVPPALKPLVEGSNEVDPRNNYETKRKSKVFKITYK